MTTQIRVSFRDTDSPTVRQYGTRFKLFNIGDDGINERHFNGTATTHPNDGGGQELLGAGRSIANGLFTLAGITYLRMRPYEVNLHRATAFNWNELHDDIMRVIAAADSMSPTPATSQETMQSTLRVRRIRWFDTRSDQVRHYGVSTRLFTPRHSLDTERNWPKFAGNEEKPLNETGDRVVRELSCIEGISHLNIRSFEVNVHRYDHFTFEEMHERVISVLRAAFDGNDPIEIQNRPQY